MAEAQHTETAVAVKASRMVLPGERDTIRIVPLHVPEELVAPVGEEAKAAATPPQLTYRGGPLLANVEVFTVFWGAAWQSAQKPMANTLNAFFDYILTSPLMTQLAEYSVPAYAIGNGKRIGSATITTPAPHHTVSDNAVRHMLQQEIASNAAFPQPGPNTLYFVFMPPGVAVSQGGSKSCQAFCGYHDDINGQIFYAAMPYPNCSGCLGSLSVQDALTSTSSHELCEAITDPVPGQGWYDDNNGEIGDICAWHTRTLGDYVIQSEWSNKNNACV